MIERIIAGDITAESNKRDMIVGMNTRFGELTPYVGAIVGFRGPRLPVELGSVVSFERDDGRYLHVVVCHELGEGGWRNADVYVRYGLDHLWYTEPGRLYSIVSIGAGEIGTRDGANVSMILRAIMESNLPVLLYQRPEVALQEVPSPLTYPRISLRSIWSHHEGVVKY